jgi:hypothetical protein
MSTPSPTPIAWEPADAHADWPGPVRNEPQSPAIVPSDPDSRFRDDDEPVSPDRRVDLTLVSTARCGWFPPSVCVFFHVVGPVHPLPKPDETWLAYGIVTDVDADGTADYRYGIDNAAGHGNGVVGPEASQRMWRTDLHTGETLAWSDMLEYPQIMDAVFPGEASDGGGHIYAHIGNGNSSFRFYVWAGVITDGVVQAIDFAPNSGWLE